MISEENKKVLKENGWKINKEQPVFLHHKETNNTIIGDYPFNLLLNDLKKPETEIILYKEESALLFRKDNKTELMITNQDENEDISYNNKLAAGISLLLSDKEYSEKLEELINDFFKNRNI